MFNANAPIDPAFAAVQPDVIATSSISRPQGLCASSVTNHPDVLRQAAVFPCHLPAVPYVWSPTNRGPMPRARSSAGAPELRTIGTALAMVSTLGAVSTRRSALSLIEVNARSLPGLSFQHGAIHG